MTDATDRTDAAGAVEPTDAAVVLDHRRLGVDLYNATWELLDLAARTPEQDDELVARAHASRYHWSRAEGATAANAGRAHWLCSRVHAVLGQADTAAYHAGRYITIAETEAVDDWDLASAHEAAARAAAVAGDFDGAARHEATAREVLRTVADAEDREVVEADLATLPRRT